MNKGFLTIVAVLLSTTVFGQGTFDFIDFRPIATSANAIPPNSSFRSAEGLLTLSADGWIQGFMFVSHHPSPGEVSIFRSTTPTLLGTRLYYFQYGATADPTPESPGGFMFDFGHTLTRSEVNDLLAGNWWIVVGTPEYPNGELRGNFLTVPEPSSVFLIVSTFGTLWILKKRRVR